MYVPDRVVGEVVAPEVSLAEVKTGLWVGHGLHVNVERVLALPADEAADLLGGGGRGQSQDEGGGAEDHCDVVRQRSRGQYRL